MKAYKAKINSSYRHSLLSTLPVSLNHLDLYKLSLIFEEEVEDFLRKVFCSYKSSTFKKKIATRYANGEKIINWYEVYPSRFKNYFIIQELDDLMDTLGINCSVYFPKILYLEADEFALITKVALGIAINHENK